MILRDDLTYYQVIDLPDGSTTPGHADHRRDPALLNLDTCELLHGARVLDVASNDGFWAFWAERQGAGEVLATDVQRLEDYDWGFEGPPVQASNGAEQAKDAVFLYLRELLGSNVQREACSVYDLAPEKHGQFDLVFNYNLIYHLRHPLLAIDRCRAVCRGACIIKTHVSRTMPDLPLMLFYADEVLDKTITNWCGPTAACMTHWMKSAGFTHIYQERNCKGDRARFVGVVDPKWKTVFDGAAQFEYCDDSYFRGIHECLSHALQPLGRLHTRLYRFAHDGRGPLLHVLRRGRAFARRFVR